MTKATPPQTPQNQNNLEEWQPYELDHYAQELVMKYRDKKDVLNESHKMRMTVAYGLERFWGEPFRLEKESKEKATYWKDVWSNLAEILQKTGIKLPNDNISSDEKERKKKEEEESKNIQAMVKKIWGMEQAEREISLMVLTQFCDCLVWWTQRFKIKN